MRPTILLPASIFWACVYAAPSTQSHHVLHEKRAVEPHALGWFQARRLDARQLLPMRFGLRQQNMHRLEELLLEVSDPLSPKYNQHYTPAQIIDTFAPSDESIIAVTQWLVDSGISSDRLHLDGNKGWIHFDATVGEVEDILKTEYHIYVHSSRGEQYGCHNYSLPAHIRDHVDLIKPTVHFNPHPSLPTSLQRRAGKNLGAPSIHGGPKKATDNVPITPTLSNCDQFITPQCLRSLYSIDYKPLSAKENSFGVVAFTPQSYVPSDLDLFFKNFPSSQVGARPKTVLIDGAVVKSSPQSFALNGESDLDLEYAMSLTYPQTVTLLQTGDEVEGAGFDNWLDAVDGSFCKYKGGDDPSQDGIYPDTLPGGYRGKASCGIVAPPHVVSVSYIQDEYTVTPAFANRQCYEYGKLGMMGTTVFHSSGDNGVAGNGGVCLNSKHQPASGGTVFNPGFPVSCPYVTAVGATQINPGKTVNDPEGACEQVIYSGGGFSNIFPMPSFQESVVKSFLKSHPPPYTKGQFNNSGNARGFPDISANGANFVVAVDGKFERVYGSSASAPVVASIFTLLNDARLAVKKGPLGFVNPLIYSPMTRLLFNDITSGGNQGCGTPGFTATTGWDPVTGMGTPNFLKLLAYVLTLA
ncbi:subtilisin-like protein [Agrocybe pediades]|nr:subtilisin-like protein [Agrocybe pediades]